ncbi:fumarylacetoacetate hydrolase family protein [Nonomuraea endophytica]|uniref:2-keto-4-pentenoate hydratase/2-oxohepta-3-ene-1,7-dioic acid hydratase in catechol pathway/regulator of RNase E activity RraA n=1 Tax=Nonomuraea endophytica TaxID=714136 RepID=A0A7W8A7Z5_9ACTN|nr:fumarylacetoacetate hydrolase family protein [Nonomuraea endophytica]MBB5081208.1 2-keto-4-pentenoate hydratase/2-oxohepta-3-ene-1,7-dioic acid hydratase in catechol pathway/regulator of RNase E activity RraA [Nonomuraea endophytica]
MDHPLGLAPGKIIAVHLNYRGRAAERGRLPSAPSYFLKPPSSLSWSGRPVVRPAGCELLTFEGEIAVVIGRHARCVPPERALEHVAGYTAANDFGVYDFRHADRGSNLRAKGQDGYTPVGPAILTGVDPGALRLRTYVNGELAQEADTGELLFGFDLLIADLSRYMTLEPGDLILAGTPAGSTVVKPGDVVEVELEDAGRLRNEVVAEPRAAPAAWGAQPRADEESRAAAFGRGRTAAPYPLDDPTIAALRSVSTATLSSQLRKRGIDHHFIEGVRPTRPDLRMVGLARTLRYLPLREDVFAEIGGGMNAQKRAVEEIRPGEVLVIEARGEHGAGTLGDILAMRALRRGAAGVVTDGGLRDSPSFAELDLPAYFAVPHAAVLGRRHVPVESQVPVACGGVLVMPGDVLVGDAEGVVVLPPALAAEVAGAAAGQEDEERFIYQRVAAGASIDGLYPMNQSWRESYRAWQQGGDA